MSVHPETNLADVQAAETPVGLADQSGQVRPAVRVADFEDGVVLPVVGGPGTIYERLLAVREEQLRRVAAGKKPRYRFRQALPGEAAVATGNEGSGCRLNLRPN